MPVRSSMEYIITFVRELINDTDPTNYQFTDQQLQDRLDLNRLDIYQGCLDPQDTRTSTGSIEWHDFFAKYTFWETDFQIQKVSGPTLVPDVSEPLVGKFHYNANIVDTLVITGRVYNVYGVAATLVSMMIIELRNQIMSWTADGTTITRIGQIQNMQRMADRYYSMSWGWGNSTQVKLVRKDLRN